MAKPSDLNNIGDIAIAVEWLLAHVDDTDEPVEEAEVSTETFPNPNGFPPETSGQVPGTTAPATTPDVP